MKYEPKRYSVLVYQIEHPILGDELRDIGMVVARGRTYDAREKELEAILTRYKLSPNSSEQEVKSALDNHLDDNCYGEHAIISLVFDIAPR
ncbi:hypothetical protein HYU07_03175 [Candidatus Woesearchaeota archaeon]|nr:hypothetical protein [Candidatus Woesearchaeota archaeon]